MNEPISALMQRRFRCVDLDQTIADVEALFARERLAWAPVLDANRTVVGVISSADLLEFHVQGRDPTAVRAWQLATYKPVAVTPLTPIADVARLMVERGIHHVVVADGAAIAGIVSALDFVRTFVRDPADPAR